MREYKGIIVYENGIILEGHFMNDKITGRCRRINSRSEVFEGNYESNQANGEGKLKNDHGEYRGNWKEGKPNGKGVETLKDGTIYEGDFVNGLKEGKGKITFPDGAEYEGDFHLGNIHGKGTLTKPSEERYEGEWNQGIRHGKGVLWLKSGNRYEGDFSNGVKEGYGKQYWYLYTCLTRINKLNRKDGRIAEGTWVKGVQDGKFTVTHPIKGMFECQFAMGKPIVATSIKKSRASTEESMIKNIKSD